jgi:hypothetical protein
MNNQAAQTMPGDLRWKIDTLNPSSSGVVALTQEEWAYVAAALSQPAGVPEGYALVPLEPTREMQKAYFDSIDKHLERAMTSPLFGRFDNHNLAYRAMLAAAPAASGGDHYNGVTQPDGSGFRHGDNSVGALPEALPKPQVANPADTTYPSPPSGASQSSNPNPVTPGLSSESGASVSERAREIVTFINGRCTNEEAGRKCLGFFVQYGDHLIRALSSPRQEGGSTATSTQGLRELADRWDALAMKFAAMGSDIAMAEAASMRNNAKELRALLTSPTTGVDGGVT